VSGAIDDASLAALERTVEHALETGDERGLRVLGQGEISLALGWPADRPAVAAKRLPPFSSRAAAAAYADTLGRYLAALRAAGIEPVETTLRSIERPGGGVAVYCVQPALDPASLLPRVLARERPSDGHPLVRAVVDAVARAVSPRVGLDAQVSNWAVADGALRYLDVTTPLLARPDGRPELDAHLFLASLPWALRRPVRALVLPALLGRYHSRRGVLLDLCANLVKERLTAWLGVFLAAANERVSPPLTEREVRRDYAIDAFRWEALLRLRRLDRFWQRRIRRRTYPFLLPRPLPR
jgi:hypothetical protein